jgi:hypothetical protein
MWPQPNLHTPSYQPSVHSFRHCCHLLPPKVLDTVTQPEYKYDLEYIYDMMQRPRPAWLSVSVTGLTGVL